MAIVPASFSIWSFVAGLIFAYFVLPIILGAVGKRGKAATVKTA